MLPGRQKTGRWVSRTQGLVEHKHSEGYCNGKLNVFVYSQITLGCTIDPKNQGVHYVFLLVMMWHLSSPVIAKCRLDAEANSWGESTWELVIISARSC